MNERNSKKSIEERKNPYIRHGRHCVFLLHVHLVFVTKYRGVCFTDRVLKHLEEIFRDIAIDFEGTLESFKGEGDHVHLLISYPPKVTLSKLVNSLKGVSTRHIKNANYPEIRKKLWGDSLWSPSYFAGSCGGATLDVVKEYIEKHDPPV